MANTNKIDGFLITFNWSIRRNGADCLMFLGTKAKLAIAPTNPNRATPIKVALHPKF